MPDVCAVHVEETVRGLRPVDHDAAALLFEVTQADCLIAAAAVGISARLATGNPKDFPMPELDVEHWPAGA